MRWKPIPRYEGYYEASERGNIRSVDRVVPHARWGEVKRKGTAMALSWVSRYLCVTLYRDGYGKMFKVHALVASAFHGPRPTADHCARHLDGNPANNNWKNIRWGTYQENADDMRRHGTVLRGEQVASAKLTEAKVKRVKKMLRKHTQAFVAAETGMSNQQISNIARGASWVHVKE